MPAVWPGWPLSAGSFRKKMLRRKMTLVQASPSEQQESQARLPPLRPRGRHRRLGLQLLRWILLLAMVALGQAMPMDQASSCAGMSSCVLQEPSSARASEESLTRSWAETSGLECGLAAGPAVADVAEAGSVQSGTDTDSSCSSSRSADEADLCGQDGLPASLGSDEAGSRSCHGARRVCVDTINGTTGKATLDYVNSELCIADAVCAQELAACDGQARSMENDFKARGWTVSINDSRVTHGQVRDGLSAGVAVGAKKHWGTCFLAGEKSTAVAEHHVYAMHWMALVKGGVDLLSVYLISGEGPSESNAAICNQVADKLLCLNRPFIIGGDWQMTSEQLESMGWVQRVGGVIVQPSSVTPPSCSSGKGRMIDYFVVSKGLEHLVADCYVVQLATTTPHRPVRIEFYSGVREPHMRVFKRPQAFPAVPVLGPRRCQEHWQAVHELARDRSLPAADRLGPLASAWFDAYETTMCGLHDIPTEKEPLFRGRAQDPSFAWVQSGESKGSIHPKTCEQARSWRWVADRVVEFAQLGGATSKGARKHRKELLIRFRKWKPSAEPVLGVSTEQEATERMDSRGNLPEDAEAAAAGFRRWAKRSSARSCGGYEWWVDEAKRLASRYDSRFWSASQGKWRKWAIEACEKGGKAAHRWTKPPLGTVLSDKATSIQGRVDDTLEEWLDIWECGSHAQDWTQLAVGEALPRPSPSLIRAAAHSIKQDTAVSGDFLHPRTVSLLDDEALEDLAELILLMEEVGRPPVQMLTLVFIPKPDGSRRPIGLLTGLMRLWGKIRRSYGKQWELDNARPYFWAGHGRPASDSAHQQSLKAEVARANGLAAASSLLDMVKCYERIQHRVVAEAAKRLGFNIRVLRLCLAV